MRPWTSVAIPTQISAGTATPDLRQNGKWAGQWQIAGSQPVLHLDANGTGHLAAVDRASTSRQAALVYTSPITSQSESVRVLLPQPVDRRAGLVPHGIDEFRLLTCLRSGPHSTEFATHDSAGKLLWADKARGAHPNPPAAADLDGDGQMEVISDDHGTLRVYGPDGGVKVTIGGPLYCLPIIGPFGPAGEPLILRSSAMNAVVMIDPAGKQVWQRPAGGAWRYYKCKAAVGDSAGSGKLTLGVLAEEGAFDLLDTDNGTVRSSVALGEPANYTPVVSGDVDGDGRDEFLVGFPSGRLVCVAERDAKAQILWQTQLDASVASAIIADVDGDAVAEIIASTSDGYVRILKE